MSHWHILFLFYVFIVGCAGSSLLYRLALVAESRSYSSCSVWAFHGGDFSCRGARALGCIGFSSCGTWVSSCGSRALEHRLRSYGAWA